MARTGRFGRLPRAAPDLSGAIAALLREAQNQYDANMVDAWKNGGEVDGKGVDDARLLEHFRKRRDALSPDDPLWAEWDNRITQYTFSIEESKMSLLWDQKKIKEPEMRAFYLKWAKKATPNSEFKRHLESQAAKWVTTAKAGGGGGRKGSSASAHAAAQEAYYDRHVKTGHYVNSYLIQIAKQYQAMPANGNGLEDLNPNSAGYTRFLDVYLDGKSNDPLVQSLLTSALAEINKFDPTFKWDKANIDRELRESEAGAQHLIDTSTTKTERNGWTDIKDAMVGSQNRIQDAPVVKQLFDAAESFETRVANCAGDPYCVRNAMIDLRNDLSKRSKELIAQGINEANIEITAPVGATLRYLDNAIAGRETDTTKSSGQDRTIFELMEGTGTGQLGDSLANGSWIATLGNGVAQQTDMLRQGGWIGSEPIMDGNVPRRDSNGEIVWKVTVNSEGDQPPMGAVLIEGSGALEGGPVAVPFYAFPTPIEVMVTAPDGTPIPSSQANPALPDAEGNLVPVDPTQTSSTLWEELPGVIGPDGVARTIYRTGDGSAAKPYLYHTEEPTITDGAGNVIMPTRDPETGAKVFPVRSQLATDPDGKPVLTFDYTPFVEPAKAQRTPLASGLKTWGTYQTASGASAASIIDDFYARKDPDARDQADKFVSQFAQAAALTTDPALRAALRDDAVQLHKTNAAHIQGVVGNTYNDYWNYIWSNQKDPAQSRREAQLRAAGITAAKYGQEEIDRRAYLLGELERYENDVAAMPITAPESRDPRRMTSGLPREERVSTAVSLRRSILDPTVGASAIKVPGAQGVLPGTPVTNPVEQMLLALAASVGGVVDPNIRRDIQQSSAEPVWGPPAPVTTTLLTENPFAGARPADVPERRRQPRSTGVPRTFGGFWGTGPVGPMSPADFATPAMPSLPPMPTRAERDRFEPPEEPDIPEIPPIPIIGRDIKPGGPGVTRPF